MHASTCPFLWLWYDNYTACFYVWISAEYSEHSWDKVTISDIIFGDALYTQKMSLHAGIKLFAIKLSFWWLETYCNNLQCKDDSYT